MLALVGMLSMLTSFFYLSTCSRGVTEYSLLVVECYKINMNWDVVKNARFLEFFGKFLEGFLKKLYPSREEPDISSSIMNNKPRFHLMRYACIISLKHSSLLNTRSNDFIRTCID